MKLHLPKILLVSVMAAYAYSQDVNQATTIITGAGIYEKNTLLLEGDVDMPGEDESDAYDNFAVCWQGQPGEASITGTGRIYSTGSYWFFDIGGSAELYTIEKGITLENVELFLRTDEPSRLVINGALNNFEIEANETATVDISQASISGMQEYDFCSGSTLIVNQLEVRENVFIETYNGGSYIGDGVSTGECVTLQGNLVFNGTLPIFTEEQQFDYSDDGWMKHMQPYGAVQFWVSKGEDDEPEPFVPISVTGTITIKSETAIIFANEGDYESDGNGIMTWLSDYRLPGSTDVLFICSSVNEESLSLLRPYAYREDSWADYSGGSEVLGGYEYIKPVDDREFYAQAGTDGKVYIYLGEKQEEGGGDDIVTPPVVESDYVVLNDLQPEGSEMSGVYEIRGKNITLNGDWTPQDNDEHYVHWVGADGVSSYEMNGSGTVGIWLFQITSESEEAATYTIGKDITLEQADLAFNTNDASILNVKGTLKDSSLMVWKGKVNISDATLSGQTFIQISRGATLAADSLEIKENIALRNYDGYPASAGYASLEGNLVLNGTLPTFSTEMQSDYDHGGWIPGLLACGYVQFWTGDEELSPLNVTGSITINSGTAVVFFNEGEYRLPDSTDAVFICSSVDEASLAQLKPYAHRQDYSANEAYTKVVEDREFYAKSVGDKVYICLGEAGGGNTPGIPAVPDMSVKPGETVVLGSEGGMLPSVQNPVQMQGGVADASGLSDFLLNNKVITGISGTLQTGVDQTMSLTGGGKVCYSIVGTPGNVHGADLVISSTSNLTLEGEKYTAATTKVNRGNVTISGKTILGTGTATDILDLTAKGVSATNFGTIAAGVELGAESTFLNQNKVLGDVKVGAAATLLNNAVIEGQVLVSRGGAVYGSGAFAETMLAAGSWLHVGNSPGYQKHTSLTIDRGATLSFSVDGPVAASAASHGSGTHSVLEAGMLTINPGTGTVTVNVEVTMGIVAAGSEPLSLTLIDAGTTNAKAGDFTLKLSDESNLLEEGVSLSFDATEGTLVLKGAVNKAALAALMDSNATNVANTMWASANTVQEMARTAEHQFLVGMPGQTTFWGAAMGSFMDISGDTGFTCNMGGYAVGLQHAFTKEFRAGIALGQSFGDFQSDDNQLKADQMAVMPTLTAQYVTPLTKTSSLSVSGHIAYGVVENEADTYQAGSKGKAEWDDQVLNIGIRAAWNSELTDNTTVSLFTGLTYQNVEQDSFTEKYTGGERDYRSGSMSSLSIPVGVTLRGIYQMEGTNIFAPELTLAYIGDVVRDNPEVKTSVHGFNREGKGTNISRSAFMLNAGANWMFDSTWSLGAFYTLESRSNQVNQSVNAALRCCF